MAKTTSSRALARGSEDAAVRQHLISLPHCILMSTFGTFLVLLRTKLLNVKFCNLLVLLDTYHPDVHIWYRFSTLGYKASLCQHFLTFWCFRIQKFLLSTFGTFLVSMASFWYNASLSSQCVPNVTFG